MKVKNPLHDERDFTLNILSDLSSMKKLVKDTVDEKRNVLVDITRFLYENPEFGSEEFKAFEKITKILEDHGFDMEKGIYEIPIAFVASLKGKSDGRESRFLQNSMPLLELVMDVDMI